MLNLDKVVEEYLDKKAYQARLQLDKCSEDIDYFDSIDIQLHEYVNTIRAIEKLVFEISEVKVEGSLIELKEELEYKYELTSLDTDKEEVKLNEYYTKKIDAIVEEKTREAREYNKRIREEFSSNNSKYEELESKRNELLKYNNEIVAKCAACGVTTSDVTINNETFTLSQLSELYDEYITYMRSSKRVNIVSTFRNKCTNVVAQAAVIVTLLVMMYSTLLDVLAVLLFSYMGYKQVKAKEEIKRYMILLGLVSSVHPLEMGYVSEVDKKQLISEEVDEEGLVETQEIAEEWASELDKLEKSAALNIDKQEIDIEIMNNANKINMQVKEMIEGVDTRKKDLINEVSKLVERVKTEFEVKKAEIRLLGTEVNESPIYETKLKLGLKDGYEEEFVDPGMQNIVINTCKDSELLKRFLQVMTANALCNVKEDSLTITVYDPNTMGQSLIGFYQPLLAKSLVYETKDLSKILENLKKIAGKNIKDMRGATITEFNTESIRCGRTPKDYNLLIILSQPKTIEDDEALTEFMRYSAKVGVMVWMVTDKVIQDTFTFVKPFDGVQNPYVKDTVSFPKEVSDMLVNATVNAKIDTLTWKTFQDKAIPDKKEWEGVTDEFIDLDPGFIEGDPSMYTGYKVGNVGDIHAIVIGGTGSGKSVFLNHLIMGITKKYSPATVELWLVDFKGAEFVFYLPSKEFPYMLPHVKACLCTSDGDYAESLFAALEKESAERYAFLKKVHYKNMYEYNQFLRNEGREDECLKRILVMIDEFQIIFEQASPKALEVIVRALTQISKVARACGIHLMFCSQSMKKTVSADILQQFTLRFGLRCDEEPSMEVMGTKLSSSIKQQKGFLYVRSAGDVSLEAQVKYRTPYATNEVLHAHIRHMAERAKEERIPPNYPVITYEEATKYGKEDLEEVYTREIYKQMEADHDLESGVFLLGMRMTYSKNQAPINVILQAMNNTHIYSAFGDMQDLINFYRTMKANIDLFKKSAIVMANSQVKDLHYLCRLDEDIRDETMQRLSTEKTSIYDIVTFTQSVYEMRVETESKKEPMFVFLIGWGKALGFGLDKDAELVNNFGILLQKCGEYNIHFIFIDSDAGKIDDRIVKACNVRICGRVDEDTSYKLLNDKRGSITGTMSNGYMYKWEKESIDRCKIYRFEQDRKVKRNEVWIG